MLKNTTKNYAREVGSESGLGEVVADGVPAVR
jgi:hypothetical protein